MRNVEKLFKLAQRYFTRSKKEGKAANFYAMPTCEERERIFRNIMKRLREDEEECLHIR